MGAFVRDNTCCLAGGEIDCSTGIGLSAAVLGKSTTGTFSSLTVASWLVGRWLLTVCLWTAAVSFSILSDPSKLDTSFAFTNSFSVTSCSILLTLSACNSSNCPSYLDPFGHSSAGGSTHSLLCTGQWLAGHCAVQYHSLHTEHRTRPARLQKLHWLRYGGGRPRGMAGVIIT